VPGASNRHRVCSALIWGVPAGVLLAAYVAIALKTNSAWPWFELVHEAGDRTLLGTVLYFEHAARELPLDVILGVAVAGSVLIVLPADSRMAGAGSRFRQVALLVGTVVVFGTILLGTLWTGGFELLSNNLLQMHTRPGAPLVWGAHWRYHFLSRLTLILFSLAGAGLLVLITQGSFRGAGRGTPRTFASSLGLFAVLTVVFAPDRDPFVDPVFLGHQVREVFTHVLVTVPLAWGVCLSLVRAQAEVAPKNSASSRWLLVAAVGSVLVGSYLLIGGLITSAASQGQTQSLTILLGPHFFEHTSSYLVVPLVAGLVYESVVLAKRG